MKLRAFILLLIVVSLGHVSPAVYAGRVPVPAVPPLEDKSALTIAEYEAFAAMANYAAGGVGDPAAEHHGQHRDAQGRFDHILWGDRHG